MGSGLKEIEGSFSSLLQNSFIIEGELPAPPFNLALVRRVSRVCLGEEVIRDDKVTVCI